MKLFISYAHKDIEIVKQLVATLQRAGHDVWFDTALKAGQSWQTQLSDEIAHCDVFVYCMTANSAWNVSEWCHWEFVTAVENDKPIMPLLMQKTDENFKLPVVISRLQYADLTNGIDEDTLCRLLSDLQALHIKSTAEVPAKPAHPAGEPARAENIINQTVTASDNANVSVIGQQNIANQSTVQNQYVGTFSLTRVIVLGALLVIALFIVLVVIPMRGDWMMAIGLITPTPPPTATPTPTATPLPTATPTITPTPTIVPTAALLPFGITEVGVILFEFDEVGDSIGTRSQIVDKLQESGISLHLIPYTIDKDLSEAQQREQVRAVSQQYNATIAIWGEGFTFGVEVFYDIRSSGNRYIETRVDSITVPSDLENFSTYILNGMDTAYIVNFTLGQIHFFREDYSQALELLTQAVEHIPAGRETEIEAGSLYFYLGTTHYFLGNQAEALASFNQAERYNPDHDLTFNNRGVIKYDLDDLEGAIADYDQAISLSPDYGVAYLNRGAAKSALGDYAGAIADLDRAQVLYPIDELIYYNRGIAYGELGDYESALQDFNEAINFQPMFAQAFNDRGLTYSKLGEPERALADYNRAIELNPDFAEAYNNRGTEFYTDGSYEDSLADFNRALEINPDYIDAYINRASSRASLGDYDGAYDDLNHAITLNPQNAAPYMNRGTLKLEQGDTGGALDDLNQALELDPEYALAYMNRGNIQVTEGAFQQAIEDYDRAIALDANLLNAYYNRAIAKQNSGDFEGAIADYNHVLSVDPSITDAYWGRAYNYEELSRFDEALADYQTYVTLVGQANAPDWMLERITELEG